MNDAAKNPLHEVGLRHEPTDAELAEAQALIAANPEMGAEGERELKLNELLRQLPDRPLASNFTAQVIQAVERVQSAPAQARWLAGWDWFRPGRWLPRAAVVALVLSAGWLWRHEANAHKRVELARSVERFSRVSSVVSVEVLKDYEAIRRFGQPGAKVDEELFAALK